MRTTYLVCYDIADDKRLRKVFKTCSNFGDHLQFSVFECDLNPSEKVELESALTEIINHDEDQVIFVGLGPAEGRGDRVITIMVSPQPQLTSTSTRKASIPLTAADKTRASMGGLWANAGARAMRFFAPALFAWAALSTADPATRAEC